MISNEISNYPAPAWNYVYVKLLDSVNPKRIDPDVLRRQYSSLSQGQNYIRKACPHGHRFLTSMYLQHAAKHVVKQASQRENMLYIGIDFEGMHILSCMQLQKM
jgi:hypothetical protein